MDLFRHMMALVGALTRRVVPGEADDYMERALERQTRGNLEGAIADYTQAIARYVHASDRALAYLGRGHVRKSAGDVQGALADYDCAIELQPGHAGAYLSRGLAHRDCGSREQAIEDLRMVRELSVDPSWRRQAEEHLRALEKAS